MQPTLLTVNYRFEPQPIREELGPAAQAIATVPGLLWKIWGLDEAAGTGVSAYCFADADRAHAFAEGTMVEALRRHPAVCAVELAFAPIDVALSTATGASHCLPSSAPQQAA